MQCELRSPQPRVSGGKFASNWLQSGRFGRAAILASRRSRSWPTVFSESLQMVLLKSSIHSSYVEVGAESFPSFWISVMTTSPTAGRLVQKASTIEQGGGGVWSLAP